MPEISLIKSLLNNFGVNFKNEELLHQAMTHKSYANENAVLHNERLEFLGDSLVNMIISTELYQRYPMKTEGELSKMRAYLIDEPSLHGKAILLGLNQYLRLGRGEIKSSSSENPRLLASAFEALVASIYLDQGQEVLEKMVKSIFREDFEFVQNFEKIDKDFKTQFQEVVQKKYQMTPVYKILRSDVDGTEVEVFVLGNSVAHGTGKNRKQAEQNAAEKAMKKVEI